MTLLRTRSISIKHLPEKLDLKRGRLFFRELESSINAERPCIVLDCARMREMDQHALHLLLCCLEEAIKRNGDVRLAAVTPTAMIGLEVAGVDRLFRIFATTDEAVESFERRVAHAIPHAARTETDGHQPSANAA